MAGQSTIPVTHTLVLDWKFAAIDKNPHDEPESNGAPGFEPSEENPRGQPEHNRSPAVAATEKNPREELEGHEGPAFQTPALLLTLHGATNSAEERLQPSPVPECEEICCDEGSGSDSDGEDDDEGVGEE
jgi:hypothetical protein